MKRHLFIINGLGLGNSTRCQALIEKLTSTGDLVDIITSGNGLPFFSVQNNHRHLSQQTPLQYGNQFGYKTIFDIIYLNMKNLISNARFQENSIAKGNYDEVWIDSDYSYIFWQNKPKKLTLINHAYFTILGFFRLPIEKVVTCLGHFIVEVFDFLLSLYRSDEVLSPDYFSRDDFIVMSKIRLTSSLVRKINPTNVHTQKKLVISCSGYNLPDNISLIRKIISQKITPTLIMLNDGEKIDNLPMHCEVRTKKFSDQQYLFEAHTLITNAGYSTLSEAIAMGIPLVLAPIHAHAEQQVNAARLIEAGAATHIEDYLGEMP